MPVASVETEDDAEELLARTCDRVWVTSTGRMGWMAPELGWAQTIDNLYAFGARLEAEYQRMIAERNQKEDR